MVERKVLLHIVLAVVTGFLALCLGFLIRYHYEKNSGEYGADTSIYEVVAENGEVYNALPVQPADRTVATRMREVLREEGIVSRMADGKVMVRPKDVALSVDLLSAANLVKGTQHFTLSDVSADSQKEPRRFKAQNRLAIQNTLSKMIPLMSPAIERASVLITGKKADVTLWIKHNGKLPEKLATEIAMNVNSMVEDVEKQGVRFLKPDGNPLR